MAEPIVIRHRFKTAANSHVVKGAALPHLVPILQKPIVAVDRDGHRWERICPLCQIHHPVKTVHLWLDDDGKCLVSPGVLGDLKLAGMPDLYVDGHTAEAPALNLNQTRVLVDRNNRAIRPLTPAKVKV